MPAPLTPRDVERIAALARLELQDQEVALFVTQLGDILALVDRVREADTAGVEPFVHTPAAAATREDLVVAPLDRARVVDQAPEPDPASGLLKVPRVVGS